MSQLIPKTIPSTRDSYCSCCGSSLLVHDNFCRHCGEQACGLVAVVEPTVVAVGAKQASFAPASQNELAGSNRAVVNHEQQLSHPASTLKTILNNRFYVCAVIALIGPLGLPALWFSPRFSNRSKVVTTIIYFLLTTVVPLAVTWYFLDYAIRPISDVLIDVNAGSSVQP